MNGFEKRATRIKEKILKTTLNMLKTWDPARIRITDIAKAAQVSQVTIYNYFGSKEDLIRNVMINYVDESSREFKGYMHANLTVKEKLERMVVHKKESYQEFPPEKITLLINEDPELSAYIENQTTEEIIPLLLQLVEDGKKSGEISEKVSTEAFLLYIDMLTKYSDEIINHAKTSNPLDLIEGMLHIFFYGVCGKP